MSEPPRDWKFDGVRVVRACDLDPNTPQTPVTIEPDAKTGAHHHGELESVIYVVRGRARMRWGDALEYTAEAGPGDFIFVPPFVPHQEINASPDEPLACVLVRSGQEPVVVNLDLGAVAEPQTVSWTDALHAPLD